MSLSDMYDSGEVDERVQELIESDKLTNDLMWESLGPDAFTRRSREHEEIITRKIKEAIRERDEAELGRLMMNMSVEYISDFFTEEAEQDCIDNAYAKAEAYAERMI